METTIGLRARRDRFEAVYADHAADVLHLAYLLTGDRRTAEDLTQEAFLKLLSRFGDLRRPESVRNYLLRTVSNLAKNEYRRRATRERHDRPVTEPVLREPPPLEERDVLVRSLRKLPYRQQVALVVRYCVDLSENETAEIIGTTPKAVRSLVTRGLAALRQEEEER